MVNIQFKLMMKEILNKKAEQCDDPASSCKESQLTSEL